MDRAPGVQPQLGDGPHVLGEHGARAAAHRQTQGHGPRRSPPFAQAADLAPHVRSDKNEEYIKFSMYAVYQFDRDTERYSHYWLQCFLGLAVFLGRDINALVIVFSTCVE